MKVSNKLLGKRVKVLVDERQNPKAYKQDKQSFCPFKKGDDSKTSF
jgi:hypothetical protein